MNELFGFIFANLLAPLFLALSEMSQIAATTRPAGSVPDSGALQRVRQTYWALGVGACIGAIVLVLYYLVAATGLLLWVLLLIGAAGGCSLLLLLNLVATISLPWRWFRILGTIALALPNLGVGLMVVFGIHGAIHGFPRPSEWIPLVPVIYVITLLFLITLQRVVHALRPDLIPAEEDAGDLPSLANLEDPAEVSLLGLSGVTQSALRPVGKVEVDGTTYIARSLGEFIHANRKVTVVGGNAGELVVDAFEDSELDLE